MKIEHLKFFVRIAALNNISQAGKEFGLSPAVSSAHVNKLENDVGVRLIHRTTRRVSLTEEGKSFLPHVLNIVDSIQSGLASIGQGEVRPSGKLRITAPASFGRMHLIPALGRFLDEHKKLNIEIQLSDAIVDLVEGGFDIAIRIAPMSDSTMIARKMAADTRILCASPSYLEAYGEPENPSDLMNHKCINLIGLESWTFTTKSGQQTIKTNNRFRTDNGEAARDAAINGVGIIASSTWCSYEALKEGKLVRILKTYPLKSEAAIWAVYPSSRLVAPKVRVFIDYLSEYFSGIPYWDE